MRRLLLFLLLVPSAFASLYSDRVVDQYGHPVQAQVRICTSAGVGSNGLCTSLATIYSNAAMTVTKSNPFVTTAAGTFSFYAVGTFYLQAYGTNIQTTAPKEILLPESASADVRANEYASIQAAINANPGKRIFIPEGTYSAQITSVPSNTTLECANRTAVITIPNSTNGHVITLDTGASKVTIRNCKIDGNASNQGAGTWNGIQGPDATSLTLDNVEITNTKGRNISLRRSSGYPTDIKIVNSYLHDAGLQALDLYSVRGFVLANSRIESWGRVTKTNAALIFGCLTGSDAATDTSNNAAITGNVFLNSDAYQFAIESACTNWTHVLDGATISGNTFDGNGHAANGVSGYFFHTSMTGNIHRNGTNSHRSGYEVVGTDVVVSGNEIDGGTIAVAGNSGGTTARISITGNKITNAGAIGASDSDGIGSDASGIMIGCCGTLTDLSVANNQITLTNASPQSAIFAGMYGNTGRINRLHVNGNKLYGPGSVGNGIRVQTSASSSDFFITANVAKGFAFGYTDSADGNVTQVSVIGNDFRGNAAAINHNMTAGVFRQYLNLTDDGTSTPELGSDAQLITATWEGKLAATLTSGTGGNNFRWSSFTPTEDVTVTQLQFTMGTEDSGCDTAFKARVFDNTTSTGLSATEVTRSGASPWSSGTISVPLSAGHNYSIQGSVGGNCSTNPANVTVTISLTAPTKSVWSAYDTSATTYTNGSTTTLSQHFTPSYAATLSRFQYSVNVVSSGCSVAPHGEIYDITAAAVVSGTSVNQSAWLDNNSGTVSIPLTAGHEYAVRFIGGTGCSTAPAVMDATVQYVYPSLTFFQGIVIQGISQNAHALCQKADKSVGYCSDAVGGSGTCTCN